MSDDLETINLEYMRTNFPEFKDLVPAQFEAYRALAVSQISNRDLRAEVKQYARALFIAHLATIGRRGSKGAIESEAVGGASRTYFPVPHEQQTTYSEELRSILRMNLPLALFIS